MLLTNRVKIEKGGFTMPRGRHWYGPGFWKGPGWMPSAGGYQGGFGPSPGWGPGRGPGWGFCRWWAGQEQPYYGPSYIEPEEEKDYLREQAECLKEELNAIEKRMTELEDSR